MLSCAVAVSIVCGSRAAAGEVVHLKSPSEVVTEKGSKLSLPPGYFLEEPDYDRLDVEMRRLQDAETRLGAENRSLRDSAKDSDALGWKFWTTVVIGAFGAGIAVQRYTSV